MSLDRSKTLAISFGVTTVALLVCCGGLLFRNAVLSLETSFADEQTRIFLEMRDAALATNDPNKAGTYLGHVVSYYPSGTKQRTGTALDRLVESHRQDAIKAIIRHLRELTGKDFGNDPQAWIKEFGETF